MKSNLVLLFIILTTSQVYCGGNDQCKWKNPQGITYDLSPLKKSNNWQVKEDLTGMGVFNMVYIFNFCSTTPLTCNNTPASVYEALEVYGEMTDNCDIIAKNPSPEFSNIDNDVNKGLQVVFSGGDSCFSDFPMTGDEYSMPTQSSRKATFQFECASHNDDTFKIDSADACNTIFRMKSQVGCKGGMSSSGSSLKMLFYILILFGAYMVVGYLLNKKQKGLEGVEALPHLEFWKDLPQLTLEGVRFSMKQGQKLVKTVQQKIRNRGGSAGGECEGYSNI